VERDLTHTKTATSSADGWVKGEAYCLHDTDKRTLGTNTGQAVRNRSKQERCVLGEIHGRKGCWHELVLRRPRYIVLHGEGPMESSRIVERKT
jgi:hypothetical protein